MAPDRDSSVDNSQREWEEALQALQSAEEAYHRTIAGSVFAAGPDTSSALELQKESLQRLEEARLRVDELRRQRAAATDGAQARSGE